MDDSKYSLWFYNIDTDYIKYLHGIDSRVQYSQYSDYDAKPFLGGVSINGTRYFIPLSSPKPKHILWNHDGPMYIMIYEMIKEEDRKPKNVIRRCTEDGLLEKILAILHFNNMIPAPEGCYKPVGDFLSVTDDLYYDLLRKEYYFCLNIYPDIIAKAESVYYFLMSDPLCCDFPKLEEAMKEYHK